MFVFGEDWSALGKLELRKFLDFLIELNRMSSSAFRFVAEVEKRSRLISVWLDCSDFFVGRYGQNNRDCRGGR